MLLINPSMLVVSSHRLSTSKHQNHACAETHQHQLHKLTSKARWPHRLLEWSSTVLGYPLALPTGEPQVSAVGESFRDENI